VIDMQRRIFGMTEKHSVPSRPIMVPSPDWTFEPQDGAAALIVVDGERFLMQRRDEIPGILYPGYWGCFGGTCEIGETGDQTIRRELLEELGLSCDQFRYFTSITYDGRFCGKSEVIRQYFEITLTSQQCGGLVQNEGAGMLSMTSAEIFKEPRVVHFDLWAIWLYSYFKGRCF
jgi:8-oxo-dGTP diphosphatase